MDYYPDTPGLGWHVWLGVTITIVPATLLVGLRFYARVACKVGLKIDDWLIVAALFFAWIMAVIRYIELLRFGLGHHKDELPDSIVVTFQKTFLAVQAAYFACATLTRSSLLLLYKRIFGISRKFRITIYVVLALTIAWFISCLLTAVFGCTPVAFFWDKTIESGSCINEVQFFKINGIANLILDVIVLGLPLAMVWRLQMKMQQKLALSGIFLLGGFAVLSSVFRIAQFQKSKQVDPTYTTVDSSMWSSIEQSLGIICACLPTLRPLLRTRGWCLTHSGEASKGLPRHYGSGYGMGNVGTGASRFSRVDRSGVHKPWEPRDDADAESVTALASGSSKPGFSIDAKDEASAHDDAAPSAGIMRTHEIWQDSSSLWRHDK